MTDRMTYEEDGDPLPNSKMWARKNKCNMLWEKTVNKQLINTGEDQVHGISALTYMYQGLKKFAFLLFQKYEPDVCTCSEKK